MTIRACAVALLLGCALLSVGCPDASPARPKDQCSKAYEQCALADGLLGVCDPVDCSAGQSAPCFVCRPQH
jgi:hypothetical protein